MPPAEDVHAALTTRARKKKHELRGALRSAACAAKCSAGSWMVQQIRIGMQTGYACVTHNEGKAMAS